jgi:hypothetical protein
MYEFHPYFTSDGSVGLYSKDFNDIFHSATGALTEAYEKFIYPIDFDILMADHEINVLDICYGIGYNSKSFLNYIFENYLKKNFSKNSCHAKRNIDTIYTDNILHNDSKFYNDEVYSNNNSSIRFRECNEKIYTNNEFHKISVTAVDNDKILTFLSPFIKTGKKIFKNKNLDFEYKNIEKYLNKNKNFEKPKISNFINFLIFEKIAQNYQDFANDDEIKNLLKNKKYNDIFDKNMRGIYESYANQMTNHKGLGGLYSLLHNIYYSHVSNCYKRALKTYLLSDIDFNLKIDDARNVIKSDDKMYNLIFLDAFTPSKCPCLWSYEFFTELFKHMKQNGMLFTYTSSAAVRSAMIEAGFFIGNIFSQRENKFIGTVAVKNKELIKYELSEYDLGLLNTTAGIFYRDKNLTDLNEAIFERRNSEVKSSNKISSSKYKAKFVK